MFPSRAHYGVAAATLLVATWLAAGVGFAVLGGHTGPASAKLDRDVMRISESAPEVAAQPEVIPLEWDELQFQIQAGAPFKLEQVPQRIRDLDGKQVRIRGYFDEGLTASPDTTDLRTILSFTILL